MVVQRFRQRLASCRDACPCISYEVSFSLSGTLLAGGGYCVRVARTVDKKLLPLAMIPLLFGIQQLCEGWVWVGLARSAHTLTIAAATAFLFFALLVWPVWIPVSTLFTERSRGARIYLGIMVVVGAVTGVCLILPILLRPDWLALHVTHHSIHYRISASPLVHEVPGVVWEALYLLAVATPLFVSGRKRLIQAGAALILAAAASRVFFDYAFASMWCLFAAALSLYLCFVFYRLRRTARRATT
jgi:hypothetical protein